MKEQSFEQLLGRCLDDAVRTGDIEAVLRRHPQEADRLRPLLTVAVAARHYYADVPQPPGGLAEGRKQLLAAARQRRQIQTTAILVPGKERRPKMKLILATKLLSAVLALVVGVTTIGGGVAMAASSSLPGDPLYPAKSVIEDIRLEFASTPEEQVGLALQFADERVTEMERLTEKAQPVPGETVARMEQHVHRAMNQAAWASDEEIPGLLEQIARRTQAQAQALEQLRTQVQGQNQTRLENAQQTCQRAHEEALAGLADPQTFRLRHQQRDGMPEETMPPEPPTREPGNGRQSTPGPAGQNESTPIAPQNGGQGNGDQEQDRQRDQQRDQQQDQQQNQDQDQQQNQDQQQSQEQVQQQNQEQNQDQNQQQNQDQNQQQNQDQNQQQNQDQQQQQDQQRSQDGSGGTTAPQGPNSSPQGSGNGRP